MKKTIVSTILVASMTLGIVGCADKSASEATAAPGESAASEVEVNTENETEDTEAAEPVPLVIDDWTEYIDQWYSYYDDMDQYVEEPGDFISNVYFEGADVFVIDSDTNWIETASPEGTVRPKYDPGSTIICTFTSSVEMCEYGIITYYPFDGGDYTYYDSGDTMYDSLLFADGSDSFIETGDPADFLKDNGDGTYTLTIEDNHEELESGKYTVMLFSKSFSSSDENEGMFFSIIIGSPEAGEMPEEVSVNEKQLGIGDTINEEFLEMTIEGAVVEQEIEPSNTSDGWYSYYSDQEDETYVVVYGTMKNLAGNDFELIGGTSVEFCFDDKYTYYGSIEVEENDGTGFDSWLKPLASRNYIIYASVPDELIDMYSSCTVTFQCSENIEWSSDYEYGYDIVFTNSEVD